MKSKKLEIEIPEGKTAVWRNGILTLIDEPEKDVKERIKTFEDACREIGIDAEAWSRDKISLGLEPDVQESQNVRFKTEGYFIPRS